MIIRLRILLAVLGTAALGAVFSSAGCRKKHDTVAKVYVLDQNGQPVRGAEVEVYGVGTIPNHQMVLDKTTTTNASGEAIFLFNDVYQLGQAGVAVVNIKATKDGEEGTGIMKVEQEETSEETVFL